MRTVRFPRALQLKWFVRTMYVVLICGALTSVWGCATLDCDRASDSCVVSEWHSAVPMTHVVRLGEIKSVRNAEGLEFVTEDWPKPVTTYSVEPSPEAAQIFADSFQSYLDHPSRPTFHATLQTRWWCVLLATLAGLVLFLAVALTTTKVVTARWGTMVRVDEGLRIVHIPPVGAQPPRDVRLDELMSVEMVPAPKRPGAPRLDDHAVFVEIVLVDGTRVAITEPELARDEVEASRARLASALGLSTATAAGSSRGEAAPSKT